MSAGDPIPLYLIDAFADRAFRGNPAAVCLVDRWPDDAWMQRVAAELKQSETAFVRPADGDCQLRWFTPAVEVDLCGHATLAGAFVLWQTGRASQDRPIRFSTRSGILTARRQGDTVALDFPLDVQTEAAAPPGLVDALGVVPQYVGRGRFDYLVEVESESQLRQVTPDFRRLADVACRGVIVTARSSTEGFDFVSRFFAPAAGVDEDPVTGSAHCTLAHYWAGRLGQDQFTAYQASSRGGIVGVSIDGDRVYLSGRAVSVFEGRLRTDDA